MSKTEDILKGSIDMHIHASPDVRVERRLDALQAALDAREVGIRAIVLKSHDYPTAAMANIIQRVVPEVTVFGSIALDHEVGGLNSHAVEVSAKLGGKVVWMPTLGSANDMKKKGLDTPGVSVIDDEGKLLPVIYDIFATIKEYRMILATGHVSVAESFALVEAAHEYGLEKIVITHPLLEKVGAHLNLDQQRQMADMGAFLEHCFADTMPLDRLDPMEIVEAVRFVGAEHCIISTDLGQYFNPAPAEGMRMAIATMLQWGMTEKEVELLVKTNPAKLLDLD
ncbi:DUF6282 family protein [Chloroflexota bacterium]